MTNFDNDVKLLYWMALEGTGVPNKEATEPTSDLYIITSYPQIANIHLALCCRSGKGLPDRTGLLCG